MTCDCINGNVLRLRFVGLSPPSPGEAGVKRPTGTSWTGKLALHRSEWPLAGIINLVRHEDAQWYCQEFTWMPWCHFYTCTMRLNCHRTKLLYAIPGWSNDMHCTHIFSITFSLERVGILTCPYSPLVPLTVSTLIFIDYITFQCCLSSRHT